MLIWIVLKNYFQYFVVPPSRLRYLVLAEFVRIMKLRILVLNLYLLQVLDGQQLLIRQLLLALIWRHELLDELLLLLQDLLALMLFLSCSCVPLLCPCLVVLVLRRDRVFHYLRANVLWIELQWRASPNLIKNRLLMLVLLLLLHERIDFHLAWVARSQAAPDHWWLLVWVLAMLVIPGLAPLLLVRCQVSPWHLFDVDFGIVSLLICGALLENWYLFDLSVMSSLFRVLLIFILCPT